RDHPPALDADHRAAAAARQKSDRAVAEVAAVGRVERDRVGAAQLVADVLVRDRDLHVALREAALQLGLDLARQIDFGEADVAMFVALDVFEFGQLLLVEFFDQPFGQDRDAVMKSVGAPLDDRAFDDVTDLREGHGLLLELLADERERGAGGLADAERQVAGLPAHRDDDEPAFGRARVLDQVAHQFDADVPRRLVAEGRDVAGQWQVIINRLRHVNRADRAAGFLRHRPRRERRVIAADRHQVGDAERVQRIEYRARILLLLRRVVARRAEDRAAQQVDARDVLDLQAPDSGSVFAHQVFEPFLHAEDFKAFVDRLNRRRRNDRIDAGCRAAADNNRQCPSWWHWKSPDCRVFEEGGDCTQAGVIWPAAQEDHMGAAAASGGFDEWPPGSTARPRLAAAVPAGAEGFLQAYLLDLRQRSSENAFGDHNGEAEGEAIAERQR